MPPLAPLEFCILTAVRTFELLGATWAEIDLVEKVWTIPAQRTKRVRQHRVPLSDRCIEILRSLPRKERPTAGDLIFAKDGKPLSHDAMLVALKQLAPGSTVHGTARSSFSDWARDRTGYPRDVVEQALGHAISDKTEAAYRRSDSLDKRRKLMSAWSEYCEGPTATGEVVPLRA